MPEPLTCPRCATILTDTEVRCLHKRYANSQRKTKAGGRNGGRKKDSAAADQYAREMILAGWKASALPRDIQDRILAAEDGMAVVRIMDEVRGWPEHPADPEPIRETILVPIEET